ncbi:hypothetical protein AgCh_017513 [Apium graveolens]
MKILFLLIVAMMLFMFGASLTNATRLPLGEIRRSLVQPESNPKARTNVPKSSNAAKAQTNEDDRNESYGNYGHNKADSSGESHHTYKCATISCD